MKIAAALLAAVLALLPKSEGTVSVAYAGSLVAAMEGPVASALRRENIRFEGEGKGSKALAHLIASGLRQPDVFISADPALIASLPHGLVASSTTFGSARMVVAYSPRSAHAALFDAAARGRGSILAALDAPGVRIGRTDPQLDPKGARTMRALELLGRHYGEAHAASDVLARSGTFPEEDLAVRVESGELDAGFFYSTEVAGRGLRVIELPSDANLSAKIAYAIAVMRNAPHPDAARAFAQFILRGPGKAILERAGVRYF